MVAVSAKQQRIRVIRSGPFPVSDTHALHRACCVKIISKIRGNNPREKVLRKLATEADYLMRVQECMGVVQLYETFEDADKVYFVCELCSGGDLDSIVEVRPFNTHHPLAQALARPQLLEPGGSFLRELHFTDCHHAAALQGACCWTALLPVSSSLVGCRQSQLLPL